MHKDDYGYSLMAVIMKKTHRDSTRKGFFKKIYQFYYQTLIY